MLSRLLSFNSFLQLLIISNSNVMTRLIYLLTCISFISLTACEEVISIDYNTSTSQIVIEGEVNNNPGPYKVKITRSVPMDQPGVYPAVSGASVRISDNAGNMEILSETAPGIYQTSTLQGIQGRTYVLTVETNGQVYTATSTMPQVVEMDTLYVTKMEGTNLLKVHVYATDPANTVNFYRLIDVVNNQMLGNVLVANDKFNQGKEITGILVYDDTELNPGDSLTIWMQCIDEGVYTYFNTLSLSNEGSASPANPTSNISNKALGYFNACSVRKKSMKVPANL
jgi:hypothetical protein